MSTVIEDFDYDAKPINFVNWSGGGESNVRLMTKDGWKRFVIPREVKQYISILEDYINDPSQTLVLAAYPQRFKRAIDRRQSLLGVVRKFQTGGPSRNPRRPRKSFFGGLFGGRA